MYGSALDAKQKNTTKLDFFFVACINIRGAWKNKRTQGWNSHPSTVAGLTESQVKKRTLLFPPWVVICERGRKI